MKKLLGILVLGLLLSGNACAETFNEEKDKLPITPESIGEWDYTCKKEDFKKYVATIEGCIALQHLGKIDKSKKKLVVFLHGDRRDKSDYKIKEQGNFTKAITAKIIKIFTHSTHTTASLSRSRALQKESLNMLLQN